MSTLLLLAAELGLILILVFLASLVYFIRRRKLDKRYVADFISTHNDSRVERRKAVMVSMKEDSLLSNEGLEVFLDKMNASEKKLYKKILNMYLGFDRKCLLEISDELSVVNNNWIEAMKQSIDHAAGEMSSKKVKELTDKIDTLTEDNEKIVGELAEAMKTMEDIIKEYSLMYAGQENPTMERLSDDYNKLKEKSDAHDEESD